MFKSVLSLFSDSDTPVALSNEDLNLLTQDTSIKVNFEPENFTGPSVEDGQPVSTSLKTIEELMTWSPSNLQDKGQEFSVSKIPYLPKTVEEGRPKVMACHDMAGNYKLDRFVQGVANQNFFTLKHWSNIDTFVYFSHDLVTVPPVSWVNSCHRNGVACLGNFITEWEKGAEVCQKFLKKQERWESVADQLVELARFLGFDGWLINIENQIKNVDNLKSFMVYLCNKMHMLSPNHQIIWYDSVTKQGYLSWQNAVNDNNNYLLDFVDGMIINYSWREPQIESSKKFVQNKQKIYFGIDIFGRGCLGGGGFNSKVALKVISKHQFSTCLYAPGWVFENNDPKNFKSNNNKFWRLLKPLFGKVHPINVHSEFQTSLYDGIQAHKKILLYKDESKNCYSIIGRSDVIEGCYQNLQQLQLEFGVNHIRFSSSNNVYGVNVIWETGIRGSEIKIRSDGVFDISIPLSRSSKIKEIENISLSSFEKLENSCSHAKNNEELMLCSFEHTTKKSFEDLQIRIYKPECIRFLSIYQGTGSFTNIPKTSFKVAIKDEHWKKDCNNLSLSCTLLFTESELGPTELWYQLSGPGNQIQYLGSASGAVYRIVNLKVAKASQESYLFVYISQPTPQGVPLLKKRLRISYS